MYSSNLSISDIVFKLFSVFSIYLEPNLKSSLITKKSYLFPFLSIGERITPETETPLFNVT
jgi:hypothetical protein